MTAGKSKRRVVAVAVLAAVLACGIAPAGARAAEPLAVPPRLRLLVVAPHPDDESLAAGGLMQRVLAAGGRVHVLFVTSGDGYPEAVALATGHRQPTAVDYRGFGELRRAEALVALEQYRIPPLAVTFLGFPDGGLAEIWRRGPRVPAYESPYTREDRPPYPEAFNPSARYVSRDLILQMARSIALADPDWIVVPTPLDSHPDHCATFTFVAAALASLRGQADGATKLPERLLTYLVHAGGWPPPASGPLVEPRTSFAPARWYSFALSDRELARKREALESHRTQEAVMAGLFRGLARSNELFGVIEGRAMSELVPGEPACGSGLPASPPAPAAGAVRLQPAALPVPKASATPAALQHGSLGPRW